MQKKNENKKRMTSKECLEKIESMEKTLVGQSEYVKQIEDRLIRLEQYLDDNYIDIDRLKEKEYIEFLFYEKQKRKDEELLKALEEYKEENERYNKAKKIQETTLKNIKLLENDLKAIIRKEKIKKYSKKAVRGTAKGAIYTGKAYRKQVVSALEEDNEGLKSTMEVLVQERKALLYMGKKIARTPKKIKSVKVNYQKFKKDRIVAKAKKEVIKVRKSQIKVLKKELSKEKARYKAEKKKNGSIKNDEIKGYNSKSNVGIDINSRREFYQRKNKTYRKKISKEKSNTTNSTQTKLLYSKEKLAERKKYYKDIKKEKRTEIKDLHARRKALLKKEMVKNTREKISKGAIDFVKTGDSNQMLSKTLVDTVKMIGKYFMKLIFLYMQLILSMITPLLCFVLSIIAFIVIIIVLVVGCVSFIVEHSPLKWFLSTDSAYQSNIQELYEENLKQLDIELKNKYPYCEINLDNLTNTNEDEVLKIFITMYGAMNEEDSDLGTTAEDKKNYATVFEKMVTAKESTNSSPINKEINSSIGYYLLNSHTNCNHASCSNENYGTCIVDVGTDIPIGTILSIDNALYEVVDRQDLTSSGTVWKNPVISICNESKYSISDYSNLNHRTVSKKVVVSSLPGTYVSKNDNASTVESEIDETRENADNGDLKVSVEKTITIRFLTADEYIEKYGLSDIEMKWYKEICEYLAESDTSSGNLIDANINLSESEKESLLNRLTRGSVGSEAVLFAIDKLGYPYSQAYRSDGKHYDCSSLVYYSYKSQGITLSYDGSNTAAAEAQLLYTSGCGVSYADMQPGDVIFWSFGTNGRFMNIGHTGIYCGGGMVVDASYSKQKVVYRNIYSVGDIVFIGRPSKLK